jgi:TRAP-type C4-dicarboxylate transport system permease small subunit
VSDATRGRGASGVALAAIDGALGAVVALIVALTAFQVGGRYLANASLPWVQELTRLMFVWMVMLGSAAACARGAHIAYDTLADRVPPAVARWLRRAMLVANIAFLAVVAVTGTELVLRNAGQRSAVLDWPVAVAYASIPTGAALGIIGCLVAARRRGGSA